MPPYELTTETIYRAYSIASDPQKNDEIELEIRYVPNGICTTYIHKFLKVGDKLVINGPYGDFYLRDTSRDIIFIAGGSGMAPIKSILHQMRNENNQRRAIYFFGARSRRDLFLLDFMNEIQRVLPNFKFIPALSSPDQSDEWDGERGLITEVVDRKLQKLENTEAYLCGNPLMIDACIKVLQSKGMDQKSIFYDKFT